MKRMIYSQLASPSNFSAAILRMSDLAQASAKQEADLGLLPEWNLADLYQGLEAPEFKADLEKATHAAKDFATDYQGKLVALLDRPDANQELHRAIARYEAIDDVLGRIISYAGLVYSGDTTDPVKAKFYGDTQDALTRISTDLLFFPLELNRLDDQKLDALALKAPLNHYRPWLEDIRLEKPYQLDDALEKLFHEKAATGRSAWNRLFDETISSLRFSFGDEQLTIEAVLNKLQDSDGHVRKQASDALAKTFKENLRIFTLISNTLAKDKEISDTWRGFKDVADARHLSNRVERDVVDAMVEAVRAAYPRLSHRYYKLKARWFGVDQLNHWDRNAPLPKVEQRTIPWDEARKTVLSAYETFSPEMSRLAARFFDERWIDAPVRAGKAPGAFAHPTVPSAHPYVLVNYQGKPRDVMTLALSLIHI